MSRKRRAPAGLEYVPVIDGGPSTIGFGVARRTLGEDVVNDARAFVFKRLHPIRRPPDYLSDWNPSCWRADVLLPPGAPDDYDDAQRLCARYEEQAFPGLKDLVVMTTIRFPDSISLNSDWERARAFARERLASLSRPESTGTRHSPPSRMRRS